MSTRTRPTAPVTARDGRQASIAASVVLDLSMDRITPAAPREPAGRVQPTRLPAVQCSAPNSQVSMANTPSSAAPAERYVASAASLSRSTPTHMS